MGRVRNKRTRATKNKAYKKSHDTKRRPRDVDQVQDDLLKLEKEQKSKLEFELDDDLPGLGQFYCVTCARHFADQLTLDGHLKAKAHKRRLVLSRFDYYIYYVVHDWH